MKKDRFSKLIKLLHSIPATNCKRILYNLIALSKELGLSSNTIGKLENDLFENKEYLNRYFTDSDLNVNLSHLAKGNEKIKGSTEKWFKSELISIVNEVIENHEFAIGILNSLFMRIKVDPEASISIPVFSTLSLKKTNLKNFHGSIIKSVARDIEFIVDDESEKSDFPIPIYLFVGLIDALAQDDRYPLKKVKLKGIKNQDGTYEFQISNAIDDNWNLPDISVFLKEWEHEQNVRFWIQMINDLFPSQNGPACSINTAGKPFSINIRWEETQPFLTEKLIEQKENSEPLCADYKPESAPNSISVLGSKEDFFDSNAHRNTIGPDNLNLENEFNQKNITAKAEVYQISEPKRNIINPIHYIYPKKSLLIFAAGTLCIFLIILFFVFYTDNLKINRNASTHSQRSTTPKAIQIDKGPIAVMKFKNISNDSSYEWLQEALREWINTEISNLDGIRVVERAQLDKIFSEINLSKDAYIDSATAVKIGKGLGAHAILTGSFLSHEKLLRIDVRLIRVETGEIAWAKSIDGNVDDYATLSKLVTTQIANSLVEK